tara:strand:- start:4673 stop:5197 length:525 start_codon:yes stop_codon:yes gene_type:complete
MRIMDEESLDRALTRIAHEICETSIGINSLVLLGVHTRGVPLAYRIARKIELSESVVVPVGSLDIGLYRDDLSAGYSPSLKASKIPELTNKRVVIVDDVLFTGRTIRAAMDAIIDFGRPQVIQLAVVVDRGHRELPIKPDYVGKNIPTSVDQKIRVALTEIDTFDAVELKEDIE